MTLKNKIFGHIYDCTLFVLRNSITTPNPPEVILLRFFMLPFYALRKKYQSATITRMKFSPGNQSTTKTLYQFPRSLQKAVVADALNSLVGEGERLDY